MDEKTTNLPSSLAMSSCIHPDPDPDPGAPHLDLEHRGRYVEPLVLLLQWHLICIHCIRPSKSSSSVLLPRLEQSQVNLCSHISISILGHRATRIKIAFA